MTTIIRSRRPFPEDHARAHGGGQPIPQVEHAPVVDPVDRLVDGDDRRRGRLVELRSVDAEQDELGRDLRGERDRLLERARRTIAVYEHEDALRSGHCLDAMRPSATRRTVSLPIAKPMPGA